MPAGEDFSDDPEIFLVSQWVLFMQRVLHQWCILSLEGLIGLIALGTVKECIG